MDLLTWVALIVGLIVVGMLLQYFFGTRVILKAHDEAMALKGKLEKLFADAEAQLDQVKTAWQKSASDIKSDVKGL